jgi:hypothetical protein
MLRHGCVCQVFVVFINIWKMCIWSWRVIHKWSTIHGIHCVPTCIIPIANGLAILGTLLCNTYTNVCRFTGKFNSIMSHIHTRFSRWSAYKWLQKCVATCWMQNESVTLACMANTSGTCVRAYALYCSLSVRCSYVERYGMFCIQIEISYIYSNHDIWLNCWITMPVVHCCYSFQLLLLSYLVYLVSNTHTQFIFNINNTCVCRWTRTHIHNKVKRIWTTLFNKNKFDINK